MCIRDRIDIDETDPIKAENQVRVMSEKLLSNQIIEDFKISRAK